MTPQERQSAPERTISAGEVTSGLGWVGLDRSRQQLLRLERNGQDVVIAGVDAGQLTPQIASAHQTHQ
jgi:hypothetical protein